MVVSQPFTRRPVQSVIRRGTTSDYVLAVSVQKPIGRPA